MELQTETTLVAIPIFLVSITAGKESGSSHGVLDLAVPDEMLGVPKAWCPNPAETIGLHVKGESMQPLIHDGYTVFVDRKQTDEGSLDGKIVVADHDEVGLTISAVLASRQFRFFYSRPPYVRTQSIEERLPDYWEGSVVGRTGRAES